MRRRAQRVRTSWSRLAILAVLPLALTATPAAAKAKSNVIVLPGATSAEGIASGQGSTFFVGDLFTGDIFRGDIQHGSAELFIDVPDGRLAAGMKFDRHSGLLFVAGLGTGQGYVYDTATASTVAVYQFVDPATAPVINDVTLTRKGAWFTDSTHPVLYFVPLAHVDEEDEDHRTGEDDADDQQTADDHADDDQQTADDHRTDEDDADDDDEERADDHSDEAEENEPQRHHDEPGPFTTLAAQWPRRGDQRAVQPQRYRRHAQRQDPRGRAYG